MKRYCLCLCHKEETKRDQADNVCCPICFCLKECEERKDKDDGNPNRPGKSEGSSRGRIPGGGPINKSDLTNDNPVGSWGGERKYLQLPFLFIRANTSDYNGSRPLIDPVFWESHDIFTVPGDPALTPDMPPVTSLGDTAIANEPNTLYAHVWNFGLVNSNNVVVEFRWWNPCLGVNTIADPNNIIGYSFLSLGSRGSGYSHKVVKCPKPWVPKFLNGGHECLIVRVWDDSSDGIGNPPFDASLNRHVGQRNIHVVQSTSGIHPLINKGGVHLKEMKIIKPFTPPQITLNVGPLYGAPAEVQVTRVIPHNMAWLQLRTGKRGVFPSQAPPSGNVMLTAPIPIGGSTTYGGTAKQHTVVGDNQQITFSTNDPMPSPGEAHVYRVIASQGEQVFGGYTIVMLG